VKTIAHIRESDKEIQTVEEHLLQVKQLAEEIGAKIGIRHITGLAGLLHDLGKYSEDFRNYIIEAVNNPDQPPKRGSVDHSTAGGKLLYDLFHDDSKSFKGLLSEIVGNAIISHHSYIQDYLTPDLESVYLRRVRDKDIPEFPEVIRTFFTKVMDKLEFNDYVNKAAKELGMLLNKSKESPFKQIMFITKYVFSALIDADRTNTRIFEENVEKREQKENHIDLFGLYYDRLMKKINSFQTSKDSSHPINRLRNKMSEQCDEFAERPSGIYTLSIPTGGGKTLASLRYALKHAMIHGKKRIIYIIPYTTIIEQNAEEVRNILQDCSNILEHHSNVIEDSKEDDEFQLGNEKKLKLAKDNWDSPIVFTTMVQFLNVFYAKGSRYIRRLHNLSDSIIIFDEVQKVPTHSISLFNNAVNFLEEVCHSSILLCTATQPALDYVEHELNIKPNAEIINNLDEVVDKFKRVQIIDKATDEAIDQTKLVRFILEKTQEVRSMLVILNTKPTVKALYNQLCDELDESIPIYHLSTSMCAAHRNDVLNAVRARLSRGEKVVCISTQLIEAGVDISFDCVIRSLAGLDSIAQAAGRCNRHGEHSIQNVYIIDYLEEKLNRLKEIRQGKDITKRILKDLKFSKTSHDILSKQVMQKYFKEYYTDFESDLDYSIPKLQKNMIELLMGPRKNSYFMEYKGKHGGYPPLYITQSYYTAAENYQVIKNMADSVIVPYKEGKELISELNGDLKIEELNNILRQVQHYTINLYEFEKEQLNKHGGIVSFFDGKILALKDGAYSEEYGLNTNNDSMLEEHIF